jgi:NagD protein
MGLMETAMNYLIDMDGVLVSGRNVIPGAAEFLERLKVNGREYAVLTNNPIFTPRDLAHRLRTIGLNIPEERFFTSAMACGRFLEAQKAALPSIAGTAFVIGESGLSTAIHNAGFIITDHHPDYVVLGETYMYHYEAITKAVRLVLGGARFVATNPDTTGPTEGGVVPACGAMAALIEAATGVRPFFVGKPNPLMMRSALNYLGVHSENTVMIGDRMDTDVIAGVQSGMDTILVLSGVTARGDVAQYPYQPTWIVGSVDEIER